MLRQSGTRERLERSWRERSEGASGLRSSVHTSNCVGERRHSPLTSVIADGWQSVTKRHPYRTAYRTGESLSARRQIHADEINRRAGLSGFGRRPLGSFRHRRVHRPAQIVTQRHPQRPFPGAQTHGGSTFAHEVLLLLGPRDRRLIITQGAALPWRDHSSNHNGQHHAALEHHPDERRTPTSCGPIRDRHASVNRRATALCRKAVALQSPTKIMPSSCRETSARHDEG